MKNKIGILSILLLCLVLTACAGDPIKKDLLDYFQNGLASITGMETSSIQTFKNINGAEYQDQEEMEEALTAAMKENILPGYQSFFDKLKALQPKTKEVQTLHQSYIQAAATQQQALNKMLEGLEKDDPALIEEANKAIDSAREQMGAVEQKVKELAQKHKVQVQ